MPAIRGLAAILAADVAGYSRLMGVDEEGTAQALREHRAAADPLIANHGGRIVKTTGDGLHRRHDRADRPGAGTQSERSPAAGVSGVIRISAGEPDLAIAHVQTSLRLSSRERLGVPLFVMGMAYFFKRQFDEAAAKLLLSIQDNPGHSPSHRFLAACYAHLGRLEEAREIVTRCARSPRRSCRAIFRFATPTIVSCSCQACA